MHSALCVLLFHLQFLNSLLHLNHNDEFAQSLKCKTELANISLLIFDGNPFAQSSLQYFLIV